MSALDKIYTYLSPEKALKRRQASLQLEMIKRRYEGASVGERMKDWTPLSNSSGLVDSASIDLLASRVEYLYNNSAPIKRGINAIANYTFGAGCVPHACKPDGSKHDMLEGILKDFVDTPACDIEGRETLYSKQIQAGIHVARNGAFLIQRVWTKDKNAALPFKLKCLSQDNIDKSKNQIGNRGNRIVQGIEYSRHGERVALWIHDVLPNSEPSMSSMRSRRFDARDFCHMFRTTTAGQVHGITWGAPIVVKARDFDDYMDAQLLRQKLSSCFVGVVHDLEGGMDSDPAGKIEGKIKPGTWMTAPPGQTVEFSQPPQLDGIKDYVKIQHHGIASGLEVPYMIVSSDFSDSNYTQSRMTLIDFAKSIESYQQHIFYPQMSYKIGQWILEAANLRGVNTHNTKIMWVYPRRDFVDPQKDMKAFVMGVESGFMSWEMAVREMGHDPEDVAKSLAHSAQTLGKIGVIAPSLSKQIEEKTENDHQ